MTDLLFNLSFYLVAPFWLLLIVAPGWRWTQRIASSPWIAIGPAVIYLVLVLPALPQFLAAVTSPSLDGIRELLGTAAGASAAWAHMVAFDLFVGRWIYLDSRRRRIHPLPMAPVLLVTILLGPVGFVLYLGVREAARVDRSAETQVAAG